MWVFGGLRRSVGLGVLNECQTRKMGVTWELCMALKVNPRVLCSS